MCGIAGLIKTSGNNSNFREAFKNMQHRGPDATGIYEDDELILGNHRLKIQDISDNGNQPLFDATNRYAIVFNGEIYNHLDIRNKLSGYNIQYVSSSDTETLLYGFIHFGEQILAELNGIFSFVIYDKVKKQLFGARDQIGVKPFYIYSKQNTFAFASELKTLVALDNFDKTINYPALANYMNYLWSPGEATPFLYVNKLLPGECFTINLNEPGNLNRKKYYEINFDGKRNNQDEAAWTTSVDQKIKQSLKSQLISDVPVGFFLSGGIDSSLLVGQAKSIMQNEQIHCFTIKNSNGDHQDGFEDDFKYSNEVSKALGTKLHVVDGGIDVLHDFDKMIWHLDEPQSDLAPIYVAKICEHAKQEGFKVLISGTGGDDVFSGYRRHQAIVTDKFTKHIPNGVYQFAAKIIGSGNSNHPTVRRINKLIKHKNDDALTRLVGYFEWFPIMEHLDLFHDDIQSQVVNNNPSDYMLKLLDNVNNEQDLLNKMLYLKLKTFLVDHNLNYTDKMGMSAGVEVRVPYLDIDLIAMSTQIPTKLKVHNFQTKYLLRRIAAQHLPQSIINRPKTGFGAPIRNWVTNEMATMVNERLSASELNKYHIFNPVAVQKLINDNKSGRIDGAYTIISIMAIQSWMSQFYDNDNLHN